MSEIERLRALLAGPMVGHEINVAIAITRAIGGNPHDAGLVIVNALPALLNVAEAARDCLDRDRDTNALRAALAQLEGVT